MHKRLLPLSIVLVLIAAIAGCNRQRTPVAAPQQPPPTVAAPPAVEPAQAPPQRVDEALPVPQQPLADDEIGSRTLEELNRNSPLAPVFFALDSAELDDAGRATAMANAQILRENPNWVVTVEGHCDERGTPEYYLALGERRAVAVKTFLVSLGISADRIRTVSYGKEFPFDPGNTEEAHAQNRRGHFVSTST